MFSKDRTVRSAIAALVSLIREQYCNQSPSQRFMNFSAKSGPMSTQKFLCRLFFVILLKNTRTVSLASFVFILFASTVLSDRSLRTKRYFTLLFFAANLSTYAKSNQYFSFLNLANSFLLQNLRVASVKFVYEGFECKNCLTLILVGCQFSINCAQSHKHHPCV